MDKQIDFNFYKKQKKSKNHAVAAFAFIYISLVSFMSVYVIQSSTGAQTKNKMIESHLSTVQLKSLISTTILVPREDKEDDRQELKKVVSSLYNKNITLLPSHDFKDGMLGFIMDADKRITIKSGPQQSMVEITGLSPQEAAEISKSFSPAIYYKKQEEERNTMTLKVGYAHPENNPSANKLSNFIEDMLIKKSDVSTSELLRIAQKDYFPDSVIQNKSNEINLLISGEGIGFKHISLSFFRNDKASVFLTGLRKSEVDEITKNLDLNKYYISISEEGENYTLYASKKFALPPIPPMPVFPLDFKPLTQAQIKEIRLLQEKIRKSMQKDIKDFS